MLIGTQFVGQILQADSTNKVRQRREARGSKGAG